MKLLFRFVYRRDLNIANTVLVAAVATNATLVLGGKIVVMLVPASCPAPEAMENADVNVLGTLEGDSAVYTCEPDFYFNENNHTSTEIYCQTDGRWTYNDAVCKRKYCHCHHHCFHN